MINCNNSFQSYLNKYLIDKLDKEENLQHRPVKEQKKKKKKKELRFALCSLKQDSDHSKSPLREPCVD